jgi:hypothetical protein
MKKSPSGVALLSILMLSIVLMFLLGAFLTINRDALSNASDYAGDLKVRQAALSGAEYARGRLIQKPDWGIPTGTNTNWSKIVDRSQLVVWEREQGGFVQVVGVMSGGGFQIHFQSELEDIQDFPIFSDRSVLAAPDQPSSWETGPTVAGRWLSTSRFTSPSGVVTSPKSGLRPVSARTANVQILGFAAGRQQWLDTTLHRPSPIEFSILGQGKIGVGLSEDGEWTILSNDPFVNEVAASDDFITPNVLSSSSGQTVSFGPDGGRLLAGNQVEIAQNLSVQSVSPLVTSTGPLAAVIGDGYQDTIESAGVRSATGGQFLAGQTIPDVNLLSTESSAFSVPTRLNSGRYRFIGDDTVEYYDSSDILQDTYVGSIPNTGIVLQQGQFKIPPATKIAVFGDFQLERAPSYNKVAYLTLGDATDSSEFKVTGATNLQGAIVGNGFFEGVGNVILQGKSAIAAPTDFGISLHVQGDLTFEPVDPIASSQTVSVQSGTAEARDAEFMGVAFVEGDLVAQMRGYDLQIIGSLLSKSDVIFHDVTNLKTVYDPAQVDKFVDHFSPSSTEPLSVDIVYQSFHR